MTANLTTGLAIHAGLEEGRESSAATGSVPASGADQSKDARTHLYDESRTGRRHGAFGDAEWRPTDRMRVTMGLRTDEATFAAARTYDPRLSASILVAPAFTLTGAWGVYHQTVDPLLQALRADTSFVSLPSMLARQATIGAQLGNDELMARVEIYSKTYNNLASQTRDFTTVAGGVGSARDSTRRSRGRSS